MVVLQLLQPIDIVRRHGEWNDADGHNFEFFADRIDFLDLLRTEPSHHRASVGNALDQPLVFKLKQRQPNVAAMGLEKITKILFDQSFPRLAPSQYDVFLDT